MNSENWFLYISGQQEGPLTFKELIEDPRLNSRTFVWKEGWNEWKRVEDVPELVRHLKKRPPSTQADDLKKRNKRLFRENEVITLVKEPPMWILWLFLLLILCLVIWYYM